MTDTSASVERFGSEIERPGDADFPFYDGQPVVVGGGRWAVVIVAVAVGYLALGFLGGPLDGPVSAFVPALLFTGLPLAAFVWAARRGWTALFRPVTGGDVGAMVGFALLNIGVTLVLGSVVARISGIAVNPEAGILRDAPTFDLVMFFPRTLIQLFGEELLTILPFLALLHLLTNRAHLSRRRAVLWSWSATAVIFGLLHLPTYSGNLLQCLVVIGGARMILTLAYVRTKNIWVSTGAHVLNDWILITLALAAG
jgi:hypothetical protein